MDGKYTGAKGVQVFILNGYIYVVTKDPKVQMLDYINVRGLFADPTSLSAFKCDDAPCFSYDDEYPISTWMIPYIKEQVLKQFGMAMSIPKDATNDGQEDLNKR